MVTYSEYLKNILLQIQESHVNLNEIKDKPGDLDLINKEMLKINGMIKVILTKIEPEKIPNSDFPSLKSKLRNYIDNYFFEKEIETMAPLYSDDVSRVKNMRLKIIEALNDKKMMGAIEDLIEKL
ncbi:hypothetical protein [Nitrosopumilus sp.]|uniref:hypothetical protein n=1 Tax=Nitrosopumilus sp. TaxID=2024843 RepID=UPI00260D62BC|nr:hypothetical protein [Nitrosopumilus sp.]